jgi:hypothetical protein
MTWQLEHLLASPTAGAFDEPNASAPSQEHPEEQDIVHTRLHLQQLPSS